MSKTTDIKNYGDYVYFCYVGNNASYGFRSYVDPMTGMECGYVVGYNKHGEPILKNWEFDNVTKRQIRVHVNEKDKSNEKKSAVEFLRNSPECFKSVNGKYVDDGKQVAFLFREITAEADAKDAVATRRVVIEAQKKALDLTGAELEEIAQIIGVHVSSEALRSQKVLDFSANDPIRFMALLDDPSRPVKALIKKALNDSVFKLSGRMILWEGKQIGADEDDAVATLLKDEKLLKAVKLNLEKFGNK